MLALIAGVDEFSSHVQRTRINSNILSTMLDMTEKGVTYTALLCLLFWSLSHSLSLASILARVIVHLPISTSKLPHTSLFELHRRFGHRWNEKM